MACSKVQVAFSLEIDILDWCLNQSIFLSIIEIKLLTAKLALNPVDNMILRYFENY